MANPSDSQDVINIASSELTQLIKNGEVGFVADRENTKYSQSANDIAYLENKLEFIFQKEEWQDYVQGLKEDYSNLIKELECDRAKYLVQFKEGVQGCSNLAEFLKEGGEKIRAYTQCINYVKAEKLKREDELNKLSSKFVTAKPEPANKISTNRYAFLAAHRESNKPSTPIDTPKPSL